MPRTRDILEGSRSIFLSASYQRDTGRQWEYFSESLVPETYWKAVGVFFRLPRTREILEGCGCIFLTASTYWKAVGYFPDCLVPDNYWKEVGLLSPQPDRDVNSDILERNKGNSV